MRDRTTGRSRGFGFVTFAQPASADSVMASPQLELDGRKIEPKFAVSREQIMTDPSPTSVQVKGDKLFVGGISIETTDAEFRAYFENYGRCETMIMVDHVSGRSRGFGFVTFDTEADADKAMAAQPHIISGKQVECKKAVPKGADSRGASVRGGRGRGGLDRGGFGGYGGRGGYNAPQQAFAPYGQFAQMYGYPQQAQGYAQYPQGGAYPQAAYGGFAQGAAQTDEFGRAAYAAQSYDAGYYAQPGYAAQATPQVAPAAQTPVNPYGSYARQPANTRTDRAYHPYSR